MDSADRYAGIASDIIDYVEKEIIPRYSRFDKAHRQDHVRMVIEQSLTLAAHEAGLDRNMVYVVAAFHDVGLVGGRENHHHESRRILESDTFVRSHFGPEDIMVMGQAVEDHRASNSSRPRSMYGLIVAEADRFIDAETIIRRTIQYGLANYPELDRDGHFQRTVRHITEKYGPAGYLKIWIHWSSNAANLDRLRSLLADRVRMAEIFNRIFDEEISAEIQMS